ncbi:hypothetical protein WJR50_29960 [Catalinimonas sp. 4WD22]|uniref:hypothetical protein n=1 Tax=Catalinimonas locisalis TaxID=3133978 RepID=UPI003100D16D
MSSCQEDEEASPTKEAWEIEVDQIKEATNQYTDHALALSEGFFDASGFVPQMGHHFILLERVDSKFELEKPEILLYAPDENGNMEFLGVEYAITVEDVENPGTPPEGFTGSQDEWHFNQDLAQWQLHLWTMKENPDGIFTSLNPNVTAY